MYQNVNNIAYINGSVGIYDGKVQNNSVRYARNAVDNYLKTYSNDADSFSKNMPHLDNFADIDNYEKELDNYFKNQMPPVNFKLRYANNEAGKPDKMAVLGAAYEEMGKRTSISVNELTQTLQSAVSEQNKDLVSADSLDINKDGNIDVGEYGASILIEDMLSTNPNELKANNINGEISDDGQTKLLAFAAKKNYEPASETYKAVYDEFQLGEAQQEFLNNQNNLYKNA